jgi:hypothetical protein
MYSIFKKNAQLNCVLEFGHVVVEVRHAHLRKLLESGQNHRNVCLSAHEKLNFSQLLRGHWGSSRAGGGTMVRSHDQRCPKTACRCPRFVCSSNSPINYFCLQSIIEIIFSSGTFIALSMGTTTQ